MHIQLSLVEASQIRQLRALSISTFEDAFGDVNTKEDMQAYLHTAFSLPQLTDDFDEPTVSFFFLKVNQELAGYCKVKSGLPNTLQESGTALEICRLYVKAGFQGQGLGQHMLDQIIQMAVDKKMDFVWLGVWSQNPGAIRLYKRKGFKQVGTYTFMLGSDPQTDYIMKRNL